MQQTDKYKLNKPGVDDPITPVPLNENADKIEAALTAEAETRAAGDAALDSRVTVLEANKIVFGTYAGQGARHVDRGFTPKAVLLEKCQNYGYFAMAMAGATTSDGATGLRLEIVEGGFTLQPSTSSFGTGTMIYIAFA